MQRPWGATVWQENHVGDVTVKLLGSKVDGWLCGRIDWLACALGHGSCGGVMGAKFWEVNREMQGRECKSAWTDSRSDKVSVCLGHHSFSHPRYLFPHAAHQAKIYGYPPHQWPPLSKGLGGLEQCTFAVENRIRKKTVRDSEQVIVAIYLYLYKFGVQLLCLGM